MFTQIFALEDAVETAAEKVNQSDASALGKPAAVHLKDNRQDAMPAYAPASV
jgi:glutamyl-tRNA reductase